LREESLKGYDEDSRGSTERAFLRNLSDGEERIRDHGNKQINEPKVEYDDASDKEETAKEVL
jgi:hypothetical protein